MTVTGNIATITQTAAKAYLQFVPQTVPTVSDATIALPEFYSVLTGADGSFSIVLEFGTYTVSVNNRSLFDIGVEDNSSEVTIDTLINSSVSFSADNSTIGWITATDVANLRLVPWRTTHRFARLIAAGAREPREWYWDASSTATDDGLTVVKPYNRTSIETGRWLVWS